jgi:hypothetical protein
MQQIVQEIYCDEAGFTGNNLMDKDQLYFAFASVAINEEKAKEYVSKISKDFNLQGNELKGIKILKLNRGKQAIEYILKELTDNIKVSVFDKKFNVACKFYEYIFEPALSEKSALFYQISFHRFISNILFLYFQNQEESAEKIFEDFQKIMRSLNTIESTYLFKDLNASGISPILEGIKTFCICNKDSINYEIDSLKSTGTGKWILDLSSSALHSHLTEWGQKFEQLKVFCDDSTPLKDKNYLSLFINSMVARKDKAFVDLLPNQKIPFNFNLSQEIQFVNSEKYAGIQIADIVASACSFAFKEGKTEKTKNFIDYIPNILGGHSVVPEEEYIDFKQINPQLNCLILRELVERSINKKLLLEEIEMFIYSAYLHLRQNA